MLSNIVMHCMDPLDQSAGLVDVAKRVPGNKQGIYVVAMACV